MLPCSWAFLTIGKRCVQQKTQIALYHVFKFVISNLIINFKTGFNCFSHPSNDTLDVHRKLVF